MGNGSPMPAGPGGPGGPGRPGAPYRKIGGSRHQGLPKSKTRCIEGTMG